MAGITHVMAGCQLFASLPQRDYRTIAEVAESREVQDELIVRRGEKASHLFLLIKGQAKYGEVAVDITNEHLGKLADVGLFTATRLLSRWQSHGAIVKTRGRILIRCPEKLPID